jgi:hypothetical protein
VTRIKSIASVTMATVAYRSDSDQQTYTVKAVISNSAGGRITHFAILLSINNCDTVFMASNSGQAKSLIETTCHVRLAACGRF